PLMYSYTVMATYTIYPLSLHDALPIFQGRDPGRGEGDPLGAAERGVDRGAVPHDRGDRGREAGEGEDARHAGWWHGRGHGLLVRSEEHTSELQSRFDLVCRLLLEKKKK